jgi:hypothetical protein
MINKCNIPIGIIDENRLLDLFATEKQISKYNEFGRFTSSNKSTIISSASRYCSIIDIGNKQYEIKEIYDIPKSKEIEKMKNGLYQYIVPLILLKLIEGHDENNKISLTSNKWARQIHMVNRNYAIAKYNKKDISNKLKVEENISVNDDVNDFFLKVDSMISSYFQTALQYLSSTGSVIWREVDMIHIETPIEKLDGYDESGRPIFIPDHEIEEHPASEEEMKFYTECLKKADDEACIKEGELSKRYFGDKSSIFAKTLGLALNERKIKYIYKAYEVYFVHLDWCKSLLEEFNIDKNINGFIDKFNSEFINLIMKNANDRYESAIENVLDRYSNYYIDIFTDLCDITINRNNDNANVAKILGLKLYDKKYNKENT